MFMHEAAAGARLTRTDRVARGEGRGEKKQRAVVAARRAFSHASHERIRVFRASRCHRKTSRVTFRALHSNRDNMLDLVLYGFQ